MKRKYISNYNGIFEELYGDEDIKYEEKNDKTKIEFPKNKNKKKIINKIKNKFI